MFKIKQIDHVVLRVVDLDSILRFYVDVLGCQLEKVQEKLGLYQLRAGSSLIDLVVVEAKPGRAETEPSRAEARNMDHLCLSVEPFDGEAIDTYLRGKGHEAGPIASRYGAEGDGPSIYVPDPEGNVVELKGPAENKKSN